MDKNNNNTIANTLLVVNVSKLVSLGDSQGLKVL